MRVAASFQYRILPSRSLDTIASSEFSTIAARCCSKLPGHLAATESGCAADMDVTCFPACNPGSIYAYRMSCRYPHTCGSLYPCFGVVKGAPALPGKAVRADLDLGRLLLGDQRARAAVQVEDGGGLGVPRRDHGVPPEIAASGVAHRPAQDGMVGVAGEVVAGVDLYPVPVRVPQVHVEGVGHAVPPGAALDARLLAERAEDVADAQYLVRLVREEPQVMQARAVAAGERDVVHGLLAEHPGRVQGVAVLDGLGQPEAERPVVLVGGADVGHHDVEV